MNNIQTLTDKTAISLSIICAFHCLAFPLIVVLIPNLAALPLGHELFHVWMLIVVIPTSAYALTMGCKKHKRYRVFILGVFGLLLMIAAAFLEMEFLGEFWEKGLTLIGAIFISLGHYFNFKLCRQNNYCACPEHSQDTI